MAKVKPKKCFYCKQPIDVTSIQEAERGYHFSCYRKEYENQIAWGR
jgi:hypothetical protein